MECATRRALYTGVGTWIIKLGVVELTHVSTQRWRIPRTSEKVFGLLKNQRYRSFRKYRGRCFRGEEFHPTPS